MKRFKLWGASGILLSMIWVACSPPVTQTVTQNDPDEEEWIQLFNGENLDGWIVKIAGHELNDNWRDTFRVEDGTLQVSYDQYDVFNGEWGHIFYEEPFSYYRVAAEYRFVGEQAPGGAGWAMHNSGIMVHCQSPESMTVDQNYPISIEVQLKGSSATENLPTANVCTPGTHIVYQGELREGHCLNSNSGLYEGSEWVRVEAEVLGNERIRHYVEGELVLEYENPQIGGGAVENFDPGVKQDGQMLSEGYISLQSESHPIEFRKVELLNLKGCMDPEATNYKSYYVAPDNAACAF